MRKKLFLLIILPIFMAVVGCGSSSHRHINLPEKDTELLSISGELTLSNISFHYDIVNHNTNVIDKTHFELEVQDKDTPKIKPDLNGAYAFESIETTKMVTVFAQNTNHRNLVLEATYFKNQTLKGHHNVNISLKSTAASLIARHIKENFGQMIDPETITDGELAPTAEAIAYVLEKRPEKLTSPVHLIPEIKKEYISCAEAIIKANRASTLTEHCILLYFAGDNNLHGHIKTQMAKVAKEAVHNEFTVIAFADLYEEGAKILRLENNEIIELENLGTLDSSSPEHLKNFIEKYRRLYPAKNYSLSIGSHGDSWRPENIFRGWLLNDENAKFPHGTRGNLISIASYLGQSIKTFNGIPRPFQLLILDACQMASIEVAYQFKDSCNFFIGSQGNLPVQGMPLEALMDPKRAKKPKDLGAELCSQFKGKYINQRVKSSVSMLNMAQLESFKGAFDAFLGTIIDNGETYTHAFGEIASSSASLNPDGTTKTYVLQPFEDPDYRDLGHLMNLVHGTIDNPQLAAAWTNCDIAKAAYDQLVLKSHQYGYRDATGLSITFPLKSVYKNEYVGASPKYHSYFQLNYCLSSMWPKILSLM